MELSNIQINHLRTPIGFDLFCSFSVSYTLEHTRGKTQTSVHFMLTRACDNTVVYDSGKLTQVLPAYPLAAALSPRTRYRLTIHAETDADERAEAESWFETGKMRSHGMPSGSVRQMTVHHFVRKRRSSFPT